MVVSRFGLLAIKDAIPSHARSETLARRLYGRISDFHRRRTGEAGDRRTRQNGTELMIFGLKRPGFKG